MANRRNDRSRTFKEISHTLKIILGPKRRPWQRRNGFHCAGKPIRVSEELSSDRWIRYHMLPWGSSFGKSDQYEYADFPVFQNRIRRLRNYMDTRKPQTLWELWRDKRDKLTFYTFWGVIIFGGLSVFLGVMSLAVSVAQTVVAFKALAPPAPTAT